MTRKGISKKQKRKSKTLSSEKWNVAAEFEDKKEIANILLECIKKNNLAAFREILQGFLMAQNISSFSRKVDIPRRTLYQIISKNGNPTLETAAKIIYKIAA